MRDGNIDVRGFDTLMERLLTEDGTFVIDNGASTFIPLWSYIVENQVIGFCGRPEAALRPYGHHRRRALLDTVNGFRSLAQSTPDRNVIVWVNEYFGRVERDGNSSRTWPRTSRTPTRFSGPFISRSGTRTPLVATLRTSSRASSRLKRQSQTERSRS